MLKWLTGKKKPIAVWVIKQIDDDLLHLCGQGSVEPANKRSDALAELAAGCYRGAVHMAGSGLVLNARLCAALVPLESLTLDAQGQAHWQGRVWRVSQVPQRCWTYEGRLTAQRQVQGGQALLLSTEDVSNIRRQARSSGAPGVVRFGVYGAEEHPQLVPKEGDTVQPAQSAKDRPRQGDDDER
ncbi:hypothetical protein EQG41_10505 [Billgrantia azerbaijanica]|nr:hypothetical protein EQG41_10505 [Halomonas azerbaijanica]